MLSQVCTESNLKATTNTEIEKTHQKFSMYLVIRFGPVAVQTRAL